LKADFKKIIRFSVKENYLEADGDLSKMSRRYHSKVRSMEISPFGEVFPNTNI